jgi:hypothetical protein
MPMLRNCSFPECETLTLLSALCFEHEQLAATLDVGRAGAARDESMARELVEVAQPASGAATR